MSEIPTPGSDEGLAQGCHCPVIDNAHGRGIARDDSGEPMFIVNLACPLHGGEGHVEVKESA